MAERLRTFMQIVAFTNCGATMLTWTTSNRSLLSASYANIGGFWLEIIADHPNARGISASPSSRHFHVNGPDILELRNHGIIQRLPSISTQEIIERDGKGGESFALSTAGGQIIWITIQIITRRARDLSISQLEIVVTAYSACAISTYIASTNRPKCILRCCDVSVT